MKITTSALLVALSIVTVLAGCNGNPQKTQTPNETAANTGLIPVKSMRDDLSILWAAIKEMHPGYGFYTDTDSLQKVYDKTYASITKPLTERDFITTIYPFLCGLKCGHTQIKHSEGYKSPVNLKIPHLPFEVLVQNHRAWVTNHQPGQLNTGDEIISINDVPVSDIINHGYQSYCDDGYNETFKELYLSEYDGFEDVCNNIYHWPGPYRLKVSDKEGKIKEVQVNALKDGVSPDLTIKKVDNYANWTVAVNVPDSRLLFLKNSPVALFRSTPFAYPDTLVFKEAFKQIRDKGVKTLILDMRHNSGGDLRVATQLLSYLADASFQIVSDVKSRLQNPAINSFSKYFDTTITQGFIEGFKTIYREGMWYHVDSKPAFGKIYGPFPLNKTAHFNGKLLVLIDGATFSSGALLSAAIKAQRKGAIFIGRETAGSEEGCNGVTLQKLTLPHTKIVVDFPWMRVISVAKHPSHGRGLIPDYPVSYSADDIVTQKDLDLKKALSLIK